MSLMEMYYSTSVVPGPSIIHYVSVWPRLAKVTPASGVTVLNGALRATGAE
jgi:hypothetical protein